MAIYHMSVKIHGRSKGQSAVACAAYRAGERLYDEELRKTCDYGRKKEVVYKKILLCGNAPPEFADRETLWNSVMKVEKARNAQFAREFEIALPREADRETQIRMLHDFFEPLVSEGMCIDFSIHDKGDGNPHCHSLATMRPIREDGSWGDKEKKGYLLDEDGNRIPVIDPATGRQKVDARNRKQWKRGMVETTGWNRPDRVAGWRKDWETCCNRYLQREDRIDRRSFEEQGKAELPTVHEGYRARQLEARGDISERCEENRSVRFWNGFLKKIRRRLAELTESFTAIMEEWMRFIGPVPPRELSGGTAERRNGHDTGGHGNDERYDIEAGGTAGPSEGSPGGFEGSVPEEPGAYGAGRSGRSGDPAAADTEPALADLMRRSERTERSIGEAESGIAELKRTLDAGRRIRERYERLKRERAYRQGGSGFFRDDEGGAYGGISVREAENPYLIRTDDLIEKIECQIERRERDAARAPGRGREEVRECEGRVR